MIGLSIYEEDPGLGVPAIDCLEYGNCPGGYNAGSSNWFFEVGENPYYFQGYNAGNNPVPVGNAPVVNVPVITLPAATPPASNPVGSGELIPYTPTPALAPVPTVTQTAQTTAANAQALDDSDDDADGIEIDNRLLAVAGVALLILLLK